MYKMEPIICFENEFNIVQKLPLNLSSLHQKQKMSKIFNNQNAFCLGQVLQVSLEFINIKFEKSPQPKQNKGQDNMSTNQKSQQKHYIPSDQQINNSLNQYSLGSIIQQQQNENNRQGCKSIDFGYPVGSQKSWNSFDDCFGLKPKFKESYSFFDTPLDPQQYKNYLSIHEMRYKDHVYAQTPLLDYNQSKNNQFEEKQNIMIDQIKMFNQVYQKSTKKIKKQYLGSQQQKKANNQAAKRRAEKNKQNNQKIKRYQKQCDNKRKCGIKISKQQQKRQQRNIHYRSLKINKDNISDFTARQYCKNFLNLIPQLPIKAQIKIRLWLQQKNQLIKKSKNINKRSYEYLLYVFFSLRIISQDMQAQAKITDIVSNLWMNMKIDMQTAIQIQQIEQKQRKYLYKYYNQKNDSIQRAFGIIFHRKGQLKDGVRIFTKFSNKVRNERANIMLFAQFLKYQGLYKEASSIMELLGDV